MEVPPETKIPFEEWMAKRVARKPFALFVCRHYTCGQPSYSLEESLTMNQAYEKTRLIHG